jgi:hypothetical protein
MTQPSEMPGVANCAVSETGRTLNIHTGIWSRLSFTFHHVEAIHLSPRRTLQPARASGGRIGAAYHSGPTAWGVSPVRR